MNIFRHFLEDIIRNLNGPIGIRLRRAYYCRRFKSAGKGLVVEAGVVFVNAKDISVGDGVWIDRNAILIAGKLSDHSSMDMDAAVPLGELIIGNYSHIGIGTIIQAHAGVKLGDYFTSSAHCSIYSYSNSYRDCHMGTMPIPALQYEPGYSSGSVQTGKNVWLGLGVSVISTTIGNDVFVQPHSVVYKPIPSNCVAGGQPAISLKNRFPS